MAWWSPRRGTLALPALGGSFARRARGSPERKLSKTSKEIAPFLDGRARVNPFITSNKPEHSAVVLATHLGEIAQTHHLQISACRWRRRKRRRMTGWIFGLQPPASEWPQEYRHYSNTPRPSLWGPMVQAITDVMKTVIAKLRIIHRRTNLAILSPASHRQKFPARHTRSCALPLSSAHRSCGSSGERPV